MRQGLTSIELFVQIISRIALFFETKCHVGFQGKSSHTRKSRAGALSITSEPYAPELAASNFRACSQDDLQSTASFCALHPPSCTQINPICFGSLQPRCPFPKLTANHRGVARRATSRRMPCEGGFTCWIWAMVSTVLRSATVAELAKPKTSGGRHVCLLLPVFLNHTYWSSLCRLSSVFLPLGSETSKPKHE